MSKSKLLEPKPSFLQRMLSRIWAEGNDPPPPAVDPLSPEAIKHLFDAIRNFGLSAAIAYGGTHLDEKSEQISHPIGQLILLVPAWISYLVAGFLFLLNTIFLGNLFERYSFFQKRQTLRYAIVLSAATNIASWLIVGALWFGKPSG